MCAGTVFPQKTFNVKLYIADVSVSHLMLKVNVTLNVKSECYIYDLIFFSGEFGDCMFSWLQGFQ
jgi:hypothetical protein